jgi:hypothetical protein
MYNRFLKEIQTKTGRGVSSTVDIPAGQPITEMVGDIVTYDQVVNPDMFLQISHLWFIGPSGGLDDLFNHSCDPNSYLHIVGKRAILISLYMIPANTEITFDYSLSATDTYDSWKMDCKCESTNCRKIISGYQYLSEEVKNNYKKLGIVPIFLAEKAFQGR